jgi:predicted PurR-regulated permease PerM
LAVQTIPSSWFPPRWVLVALLLGGLGWLFYALRGVLTPLFAAFLIAYVLDPVVDKLEERKIPRVLAIVILLAGLLGVITLFVVLVLPGVVRDVAGFARDLPQQVTLAVTRARPWLAQYGVQIPHSVGEALTQYQVDAQSVAQRAIAPAGAVLRWVVGGTSSLIGMLGTVFVVPVVSFYLLYDFDRMKAGATELVPQQWRAPVVEIAREIDDTLGHFVRGQLMVMAILGMLYAVAYSALGVRLAIPIGIVAGLIAFIPYVGGATALLSALALSLIDYTGWQKPVGVLAAYVVIQVLDGFVITPRVVGEKVGLSPVWVLIALLVGAELFGFLGVLLALPTAAVLKIFVMRGVRAYRESRLFQGVAAEGAAEGATAAATATEAAAATAAEATAAPPSGPATATATLTAAVTETLAALAPGTSAAAARDVTPEAADLAAEAAVIEAPRKPADEP